MTNTGAAETGKDLTPPPAFVLWVREGCEPWQIVARGSTYGEVVRQIGCGDRPNGCWLPLVVGKHPNKCGAPDRPLRPKPKPVALAAAATPPASLWGAEV